jgi:hypothetical protein
VLALAVLTAGAGPVRAQSVTDDGWTSPRWMGDAALLSINALVSGATAGALQHFRGESFGDGFVRGALGGSVHYAGMRVASQRFDGAGLVGRQVSAAGISMVRNASDGRPLLQQMFVPLGPLHLYVDLTDGISVRPKVNVSGFTVLLSAMAEPALDWDAGATLSAGAPVFRVSDRSLIGENGPVDGYVRFGSIFVSDMRASQLPHVLAHERAHVLQGDWMFLAWSDPMESWILKRVPLGSTLYRYADINMLAAWMRGGAYVLFDVEYGDRLHEIEAEFLAGR